MRVTDAEGERLVFFVEEIQELIREIVAGDLEKEAEEARDVKMAIGLMLAGGDLDQFYGRAFTVGIKQADINKDEMMRLCLEASKEACKTLRHGFRNSWPADGPTNRNRLSNALGRLYAAITFRGVSTSGNEMRARFEKKRKYFHYQEGVWVVS